MRILISKINLKHLGIDLMQKRRVNSQEINQKLLSVSIIVSGLNKGKKKWRLPRKLGRRGRHNKVSGKLIGKHRLVTRNVRKL